MKKCASEKTEVDHLHKTPPNTKKGLTGATKLRKNNNFDQKEIALNLIIKMLKTPNNFRTISYSLTFSPKYSTTTKSKV